MRYTLAAVIFATATGAHAEPIPADFQRLCGSLDQHTCWIKPGSKFCPTDRGRCEAVPESPIKVLAIRGTRVSVDTNFGRGTIPLSAIVVAEPEN